ncbi:MAG: NAD-dependent epimerase/dehydratase family protein [Lentisphaerae bacterium]|nr:NAD-dependent epimerase/dehydratase family protein [Lentisphaerota bacterium]
MQSWPATIDTTEQLDEVLSRPSAELVAFMRRLDGDLLILGAGGKMGPTLARMARRAADEAGVRKDVIAVARKPLPEMEAHGVRSIACDLMDLDAVRRLPRVANVIYMAGRKFGSTGAEHLTWASNVILPYHIASTFTPSRVVMFSTGCVYPILHVDSGGATEATPPEPVGEYAQSCLGRERVFDYFSATAGEKVVHIRLFYAVELRYGVLVDVASRVWHGEPVDVQTGHANVIWQGDAADQILRSLALAASPAVPLNVTGPIVSIRRVAEEFGQRFNKPVRFVNTENGRGYLGNAAQAIATFGPLSVPVDQMVRWIAHWFTAGGNTLGKPTHFEAQDGRY